MKDILIIGQGLAGTTLAFELLDRGMSVQIIDDKHASASSLVGIATINPVTGRRYAKSWNIDALLPHATDTYARIGETLGNQYLSASNIVQVLPDTRVEEIWMLRATDPEFQSYLDEKVFDFKAIGLPGLRSALIRNARHLLVSDFLHDSARWFFENDMLLSETFHRDDLHNDVGNIVYKNTAFRHIVFCTGYSITKNPLFDWLEIIPMKGEYLICQIPGLGLHEHLKSGISIIPLPGSDMFWCGSTYDRYNQNGKPTNNGQKRLIESLHQLVDLPVIVVHHGAGIRATTKDRRPYVGTHPDLRNIHVITGLGTKGASLAPYCAMAFANFLSEGKTIPEEIDALRHFVR